MIISALIVEKNYPSQFMKIGRAVIASRLPIVLAEELLQEEFNMNKKVLPMEEEETISFNQGDLEIRILKKFGIVENVFLGYTGESPRMYLTEEELFFIFESLKEYFKERTK